MTAELPHIAYAQERLAERRRAALDSARNAGEAGDTLAALQALLDAAIQLGQQGLISESLAELEKLIARAKRLRLHAILLRALDEAGSHHLLLGHLNAAMRRWISCLETALDSGDDAMLVRAHLGIGKVYFGARDYRNALHNHLRSLDYALALQASEPLTAIYICIANDYLHLGQADDALACLQLGKRSLVRFNHPQLTAECQLYMATALTRLGEFDAAQQALSEARMAIRDNRHHWSEFHAALIQAELDAAQQLPGACLQQLQLAHKLAHELQSGALIEAAELALYRHHKQQAQYAQALASHRRYHATVERNLASMQETQLLGPTLRQAKRLETRLRLRQSDQENLALQARLLQHQAVLSTLSREVETDALTGVANRRALENQLDQLALHSGLGFSMLMLDIDHFKAINDSYGHAVGDAVLAAIGQLLRDNCRNGETIARYGGEEFCLLLPGLDLAAAHAIAERVRRRVAAQPWRDIANGLAVTTSIGCATAHGDEGPRGVLARADALLYRAKKQGRNRVCDETSGDFLLG
ncbi:diguanylate cyclase (GGDEF) domain-containing protein [Andreprevotia lacus DSM 23236]|jgi:diguanylate cyclase (GGDEF)-like protein|uniref:diguanylate cyclase n=1 Tax=Andreprevotia lacus DSM 23236 TaxID=1121001 RepID=A0A1W1XDA7_9NEIS|nr:GGDEF domain-containing protein [Andreprevotia lacus]SMC21842.1 diguanylate cyclase (GGDEF) domain-containing protein [Andreprevotia lacus DSM 23236]